MYSLVNSKKKIKKKKIIIIIIFCIAHFLINTCEYLACSQDLGLYMEISMAYFIINHGDLHVQTKVLGARQDELRRENRSDKKFGDPK